MVLEPEIEANKEAKSYQTCRIFAIHTKMRRDVAVLNGVTRDCRRDGSWSNATTTTKQQKNEANGDTKDGETCQIFTKVIRK